ncbi:hypothetical protein ABEB36_002896 [Hypothenemus hampei]|uniref:Uncharacterized protein n=1 Tax=Hypothenemus hampei TaxID=57062 RepID=A0ABD1F7E9_HYPHA
MRRLILILLNTVLRTRVDKVELSQYLTDVEKSSLIIINFDGAVEISIKHVPKVIVDEKHVKYVPEQFGKCSAYVIAPKTAMHLKGILNDLFKFEVEQNAKFLVVVNDINDNDTIAVMVDILWKFRLPNSLIINCQDSEAYYKLELSRCGSGVRPLKFLNTDLIYIDFNFKFAFRHCPLKVLWSHYIPFVYERNQNYRGIIIDFLLDTISTTAERPLLLSENDTEYFEEISMGYNYESVRQDLVDADIFVGATDIRLMQLFNLSPVLDEDQLIFLVPCIKIDYFKQVHKFFSITLLAICFCVMTIIIIIIYCFAKYHLSPREKRFEKFMKISIILIGMLFGSGWHMNFPHYFRLRLYLSHLMFSVMVINFFIQGSFVSVLSSQPYEPSITDVKGLLESNWSFKTNSLMANALSLSYKSLPMMHDVIDKLVERTEIIEGSMKEDIFDRLMEDKDYATITVKAFIYMKPNMEKTFSYFPMTTLYICVLTEKNSFKSHMIGQWVARAVEIGLYEKHKRFHQFQLALKWDMNQEESTFHITIEHVKPATIFLVSGCILGIITFLFELICHHGEKFRAKKNTKITRN